MSWILLKGGTRQWEFTKEEHKNFTRVLSHTIRMSRHREDKGFLYACLFTLCCCFCCYETCEGWLDILCCQI
ncbi:hypothetical protein KP509_35G018100 [Ceratopteris richardii]|uniref:Cysteine-rich transmembrane domain-containing protein n=1 Tax=Ceratopteris richardii TaxID=49495 RepID=A0A8T2QDJ9_CERRI|nr:hypothetical protein KP509_35G018100 [Ceratopteris richardii]